MFLVVYYFLFVTCFLLLVAYFLWPASLGFTFTLYLPLQLGLFEARGFHFWFSTITGFRLSRAFDYHSLSLIITNRRIAKCVY